MLRTIILCLFLVGCSTVQPITKVEQTVTPDEVAKVKITPNLDLPEPLDLSPYKIDEQTVKQYKDGNQLYIAIPEQSMQTMDTLLLVLKTRILELTKIIVEAKKLM